MTSCISDSNLLTDAAEAIFTLFPIISRSTHVIMILLLFYCVAAEQRNNPS